jgi:ATP-dependent exoDNAse (exonuclease V) alpha subunit
MVDESSLASTQQMREFFNKIGPQNKVLLIGDTRQHQGVDVGKPFEQLQRTGMRRRSAKKSDKRWTRSWIGKGFLSD